VSAHVHRGQVGAGRVAELATNVVPSAAPLYHRTVSARWVPELGRAAMVWLPVFALSAERHSSVAEAVAATSLLTAVWFLALRSAINAVPFTLGPAVPAALGTLTGLVAVSALGLWLPGLDLPVRALAFLAISVFALSTGWEMVCRRLVAAKRRVMVVGTNSCASEVVDAVEGAAESPFTVVGMVNDASGVEPVSRVPLLGSIADLSHIVEAQRPDLIVLAEGESSERALNCLLDVASGGFKVVGVTHFFEHAFGWVPLRHLTPTWFMSILHLHQRPYTRFAKRSFDVVVASVGLLVSALLMPVIALLVRLTPGPVIYRQTRVGEGGRLFTMYKFRTMAQDAEEPGRPLFAAEQDPRATRAGRLLRKSHLDELPQLWNVLKGEMSIVGPRPERPEFIGLLQETVPFLTRRLLIKPGITGWAQLRCDYASDSQSTADRLSYDLWYLRHRNLIVDSAICAKTFSALLLHNGR
jgi:exopolysaccharide biosynthesis polyprenyl glycosylphosphotransferase